MQSYMQVITHTLAEHTRNNKIQYNFILKNSPTSVEFVDKKNPSTKINVMRVPNKSMIIFTILFSLFL